LIQKDNESSHMYEVSSIIEMEADDYNGVDDDDHRQHGNENHTKGFF